jgi:hypothetical protein
MSRFITYPSLVEKEYKTILIVDASNDNIEDVGLFCKASQADYDIYLYKEEINDTDWLNTIANFADCILVNIESNAVISGNQIFQFGLSQRLNTPLAYFQEIESVKSKREK